MGDPFSTSRNVTFSVSRVIDIVPMLRSTFKALIVLAFEAWGLDVKELSGDRVNYR